MGVAHVKKLGIGIGIGTLFFADEREREWHSKNWGVRNTLKVVNTEIFLSKLIRVFLKASVEDRKQYDGQQPVA